MEKYKLKLLKLICTGISLGCGLEKSHCKAYKVGYNMYLPEAWFLMIVEVCDLRLYIAQLQQHSSFTHPLDDSEQACMLDYAYIVQARVHTLVK